MSDPFGPRMSQFHVVDGQIVPIDQEEEQPEYRVISIDNPHDRTIAHQVAQENIQPEFQTYGGMMEIGTQAPPEEQTPSFGYGGMLTVETSQQRQARREYLGGVGDMLAGYRGRHMDLPLEQYQYAVNVMSAMTGDSPENVARDFDRYAKLIMGATTERKTFAENIQTAFQVGRIEAERGIWGMGQALRVAFGQEEDPTAMRRIEQLARITPDHDMSQYPIFQQMVAGTVRQGIQSIVPMAATATGLGLIATGVGSAAGVGTIALAKISMAASLAGSFTAAYTQMAGSHYLALREMTDAEGNRIDPQVAAINSLASQAVGAGLETLGSALIPGVGKAMTGGAARGLQNFVTGSIRAAAGDLATDTATKIARVTGQYVLRSAGGVGSEILTELGQELISIAAEDVAKGIMNERGAEFAPGTQAEIAARLTDVARETFLSTVLISGAGAAVETRAEIRQANDFDIKQKELGERIEQVQTIDIEAIPTTAEIKEILAEDQATVSDLAAKVQQGTEVTDQEFISALAATRRLEAFSPRLDTDGSTASVQPMPDLETEESQAVGVVLDNPEVRNVIQSAFRMDDQQTDAAIMVASLMSKGLKTDVNTFLGNIEFTTDEARAAEFGAQVGRITPNTRALMAMRDGGEALIYATQKADFSSFSHELSHVARLMMEGDLLAQAEKAFNVRDGRWEPQHEEDFAKGFEVYLREGVAKTEEHKNIFQRIAAWFRAIYPHMKARWRLNPEVTKTYDALLGFIEPQAPQRPAKMRKVGGDLVTQDTGSTYEIIDHSGGAAAAVFYEIDGKTYRVEDVVIENTGYAGVQDQLIQKFTESLPGDSRLVVTDPSLRQAFSRHKEITGEAFTLQQSEELEIDIDSVDEVNPNPNDIALHNLKVEIKQALWDNGYFPDDANYDLKGETLEELEGGYINEYLEAIGDRRTLQEIYDEHADDESADTFQSSSDLFEWAKRAKGTTENINEAGYVLPDGTMLDFSGKRSGAMGGDRQEDHRQLNLPLTNDLQGTDLMVAFMRMGGIRIDAGVPMVDIAAEPTRAQEKIIKRLAESREEPLVVGLEDRGRTTMFESEADPVKTVGQIRRFFKGESINTRTLFQNEAFKEWFGDSKVVDESGDPLKVYHGGPLRRNVPFFDKSKRGISTGAPSAELGFFFTNERGAANTYAFLDPDELFAHIKEQFASEHPELTQKELDDMELTNEYEQYEASFLEALEAGKEGYAFEGYLSLQNPLIIDHEGKRTGSYAKEIERAIESGHDGVIIRNTHDASGEWSSDKAHDVYVAFEPNQIKDVNNRGTWSRETANTLFQDEEFQNWFSESTEKNAVYHATNTEFEGFQHEIAQDVVGRTQAIGLGKGKFYFSRTWMPEVWEANGQPIVKEVFLNIEKPMTQSEYHFRYKALTGREIWQSYDETFGMAERDAAIAELDRQIRKEGYDGITDEDTGQVAVFEAAQIWETRQHTQSRETAQTLLQDESPLFIGTAQYSPAFAPKAGRAYGVQLQKSKMAAFKQAVRARVEIGATARTDQIRDILSNMSPLAMRAMDEFSPDGVKAASLLNTRSELQRQLGDDISPELREILNRDVKLVNDLLKVASGKAAGGIVFQVPGSELKKVYEWNQQVPYSMVKKLSTQLEADGMTETALDIRRARREGNLDVQDLYMKLTDAFKDLAGNQEASQREATKYLFWAGIDGVDYGDSVTSFAETEHTVEALTLFQEELDDSERRNTLDSRIEEGEFVSREELEKDSENPTVAQEIYNREALYAEAWGYTTFDEFLESASEVDGYTRTDDYYQQTWEEAQAERLRQQDLLNEQFSMAVDEEIMHSLLIEATTAGLEHELPLTLAESARRIENGQEYSKTAIARDLAELRKNPGAVRTIVQRFPAESDLRLLVDTLMSDFAIEERALKEIPIQKHETGRSLDAQLDRAKTRLKATDEALKSARRESKKQSMEARERLSKEVRAARDTVRNLYRRRAYINQMVRRVMRKPSKATHVEQAQAILDLQKRYNPRKTERMRQLVDMYSRAKIKSTSESGTSIIEGAIGREDMQIMKVEALEALAAKVEALRKEGRAKYKAQMAEETQIIHDARREMHEVLGSKEIAALIGKGSKEAQRMMRTKLSDKINFQTLRPERVAQILDGNEQKIFYEWYWRKVNEATNQRLKNVRRRMDQGHKKMKDLGIRAKDLAHQVQIDGLTYTMDDMISIYVAMQDEYSRDAIIYGNRISVNTVNKIIDSLPSNMKQWGDWMIDSFSGDSYSRLQEVFMKDANAAMRKVERYFPMLRAEVYYDTLSKQVADDLLARTGRGPASVNKGFTNTRIRMNPRHQTPIRLGATQIWRDQIDKQEHYIAHGMLVKRINRIMHDQALRSAIATRYGTSAMDWLEKYLQDVSHPNIYDVHDTMRGVSKFLRSNIAMAALTFNAVTAFKQVPSMFMYLPYSGPKHLLASAAKFMARPKYYMNRAAELDPQVRERAINREEQELKQISQNPAIGVRDRIANLGMAPIRFMDRVAVSIGWNAVYEKALARGLSETEAIEAAQTATLRTQPAGRAKDLAQVYRGPEAYNWFLMFSNQLNQNWNMLTYDMWHGPKEHRISHALATATALTMSALVIGAIGRRGFGDEPKDYAEDLLKNLMSAVPFVGKSVSSGIDGWLTTGVDPLPLASELGDLLGVMFDEEQDWDEYLKQSADLLEEATRTFGIPGSVAALRSWDATIEQLDQTDPWGPDDVFKIIIGGEPK